MCGHFFDHGVGKVLAQVAPIAAAFIPGLGPLASAALTAGVGGLSAKLQGGNWGDALKGAAISGLGALAAPIAGNALSGAFPETAGSLGISGGYDTALGKGFGGLDALSGAASAGSPAVSALDEALGNTGAGMSAADKAFLGNAQAAAGGATMNDATGTGLLSGLGSKIEKNPIGALGALLTVGNAMKGGQATGTQSQGDILAQQQAKQAQDAQFSKDTINMLNSASSGRAPVVPSITDYYTYGARPEQRYFDNINTPIKY